MNWLTKLFKKIGLIKEKTYCKDCACPKKWVNKFKDKGRTRICIVEEVIDNEYTEESNLRTFEINMFGHNQGNCEYFIKKEIGGTNERKKRKDSKGIKRTR